MDDSFVVTGQQVPRLSSQRPYTASSKDFGYYTKLPYSTVDETLFGSHHPSTLQAPVSFPAPWERQKLHTGKSKPKTFIRKGPPLLWAPAPSEKNVHDSNKSVHIQTINGVPLKHQFRSLKHTPTFVDESLFGDPLTEPSFKAPWEEKKKATGKKQILNWYPEQIEEKKPRRHRRPATALGLRSSSVSSSMPVWKP